jgi:hypothetical protein
MQICGAAKAGEVEELRRGCVCGLIGCIDCIWWGVLQRGVREEEARVRSGIVRLKW